MVPPMAWVQGPKGPHKHNENPGRRNARKCPSGWLPGAIFRAQGKYAPKSTSEEPPGAISPPGARNVQNGPLRGLLGRFPVLGANMLQNHPLRSLCCTPQTKMCWGPLCSPNILRTKCSHPFVCRIFCTHPPKMPDFAE